MTSLKLIRDGMNLPFKIQAHGPDGPTLAGVYRPLSREAVTDLTADVNREPAGKARVRATAAKVAERVVSWDCEDGPPTAENVAALPPAFFDALELVVTGYARSGADDEKKSALPQC
ncbi:hypothetical protein [Limnoglobus roseus]|uniref:Phage tail assembly protein n=1 Tax=Limnoglobus roseus TaxID=2598579 RepID=A0A5C1AN25_9BACT|nr:hypothetical protein [Limnoglobus roseus]QEL18318.1 hypothetical protein PX52LOC_05339 [Limnoglobus roseus]